MMLHGIPVTLIEKVETSADPFGNPIYNEQEVVVDNVIVGEPTTDDITSAVSLYGKKATYILGIPKGDTHNWEDTKVKFFGKTWKTFGFPIKGIDDLVPLEWNTKVMVERYE